MIGGNYNREPVKFASSYVSTTALALNTPETIFSAAANVNGAIVHAASVFSWSGNPVMGAVIIAATSAPASITGGIPIVFPSFTEGASGWCGALSEPIRLPPGYGLYAISNVADNSGRRASLYTLL